MFGVGFGFVGSNVCSSVVGASESWLFCTVFCSQFKNVMDKYLSSLSLLFSCVVPGGDVGRKRGWVPSVRLSVRLSYLLLLSSRAPKVDM